MIRVDQDGDFGTLEQNGGTNQISFSEENAKNLLKYTQENGTPKLIPTLISILGDQKKAEEIIKKIYENKYFLEKISQISSTNSDSINGKTGTQKLDMGQDKDGNSLSINVKEYFARTSLLKIVTIFDLLKKTNTNSGNLLDNFLKKYGTDGTDFLVNSIVDTNKFNEIFAQQNEYETVTSKILNEGYLDIKYIEHKKGQIEGKESNNKESTTSQIQNLENQKIQLEKEYVKGVLKKAPFNFGQEYIDSISTNVDFSKLNLSSNSDFGKDIKNPIAILISIAELFNTTENSQDNLKRETLKRVCENIYKFSPSEKILNFIFPNGGPNKDIGEVFEAFFDNHKATKVLFSLDNFLTTNPNLTNEQINNFFIENSSNIFSSIDPKLDKKMGVVEKILKLHNKEKTTELDSIIQTQQIKDHFNEKEIILVKENIDNLIKIRNQGTALDSKDKILVDNLEKFFSSIEITTQEEKDFFINALSKIDYSKHISQLPNEFLKAISPSENLYDAKQLAIAKKYINIFLPKEGNPQILNERYKNFYSLLVNVGTAKLNFQVTTPEDKTILDKLPPNLSDKKLVIYGINYILKAQPPIQYHKQGEKIFIDKNDKNRIFSDYFENSFNKKLFSDHLENFFSEKIEIALEIGKDKPNDEKEKIKNELLNSKNQILDLLNSSNPNIDIGQKLDKILKLIDENLGDFPQEFLNEISSIKNFYENPDIFNQALTNLGESKIRDFNKVIVDERNINVQEIRKVETALADPNHNFFNDFISNVSNEYIPKGSYIEKYIQENKDNLEKSQATDQMFQQVAIATTGPANISTPEYYKFSEDASLTFTKDQANMRIAGENINLVKQPNQSPEEFKKEVFKKALEKCGFPNLPFIDNSFDTVSKIFSINNYEPHSDDLKNTTDKIGMTIYHLIEEKMNNLTQSGQTNSPEFLKLKEILDTFAIRGGMSGMKQFFDYQKLQNTNLNLNQYFNNEEGKNIFPLKDNQVYFDLNACYKFLNKKNTYNTFQISNFYERKLDEKNQLKN